MKVFELTDSRPVLITVQFEFTTLSRMLKMKVNAKTATLKSLRPLLSERFGADFGHIRLRFTART